MLIEWKECLAPEFKNITEEDVAVVVVGSLEQHAKHLPVGTDAYLGINVVKEAAKSARRRIFLLPPVTYGFSAHHMDFRGSITLRQKTLISLLEDIGEGVYASGFRNLIFLISHGGNSASVHVALNELGLRYHDYTVISMRYWDFIKKEIQEIRDTPPGGMGHAGELETSLMLCLYPEFVGTDRKNYELAEGNEWHHPDMFAANTITTYQRFCEISPYGNVGTCDTATAEKGERILECLTKKIGKFMDEYPYGRNGGRDDTVK